MNSYNHQQVDKMPKGPCFRPKKQDIEIQQFSLEEHNENQGLENNSKYFEQKSQFIEFKKNFIADDQQYEFQKSSKRNYRQFILSNKASLWSLNVMLNQGQITKRSSKRIKNS